MKHLQGHGVSGGITIGKVKIYQGVQPAVERRKVPDTARELALYEFACEQAARELEQVYRQAISEVGKQAAEIFEAQLMLLRDGQYDGYIRNMIHREYVNAGYAVYCAGEYFAKIFGAMPDEMARARRMDMKDISYRIISLLEQQQEEGLREEAYVIVCREITPGAVMALRGSRVLAYVTENGSCQSHAAILARSMNIPAVTGVDINGLENGMEVAVDGDAGSVYILPDEATRNRLTEQMEKKRQLEEARRALIGLETVTASGRKVALYANIGSRDEVAAVLEQDGEGIGLLRTEFLFLGRSRMPEEEEQYLTYKYIVQQMQGKRVVIRTLDIGGDKPASYLQLQPEENPALGYRGIRICLDHRELFLTQLRAILRAAAHGQVAVMFPMITSLGEVRQAKELLQEARQELAAAGIDYGPVQVGIMVETPAAVVLSTQLAAEVDFFSIGTNDLTQYTLAADRQNPAVQNIYDTHHPAILQMVKMVIDSAHRAGIPVSICGELGADTTLTEQLVHMGLDAFSVVPGKLLELKEKILQSS